jgi:hypothetical protein
MSGPYSPSRPQNVWACSACGRSNASSRGVCLWPGCEHDNRPQPNRHFAKHTDETLVRYWNEGDGSIAWLSDLEAELTLRGFQPRSAFGKRRIIGTDYLQPGEAS